mgnify:CR=1 FL=1
MTNKETGALPVSLILMKATNICDAVFSENLQNPLKRHNVSSNLFSSTIGRQNDDEDR